MGARRAAGALAALAGLLLIALGAGPTGAAPLASVFATGGETFETAGATGTAFADPLADLAAWTTVSGEGTVAGGVLTTVATTADDVFVLTNAGAYTDVTFEAAVSDESTAPEHHVGLVLRYGPAGYYDVTLNNKKSLDLRKTASGGTPTTLASFASPYQASTFYWLRVVASGSTLTVFGALDVNGAPGAYTQVLTVTDATYPAGAVGFLNDNNKQTGRARFKGPKVTATLPQDWGGIIQTSGHPGLIWDRTAGSAHGGVGSLQLFGGAAGAAGYAAQTTADAVSPNAVYAASGWIKTKGATGQIVLVEQPSGTQTVVGAQSGSAGWTQYSKTIVTRANTTSLEARVVLSGAGTASFDDIAVALVPATPTPTVTATPTRTPTVTPSPTPTGPCQLFTAASSASLPVQLTGGDVTATGTLADLSVTSGCATGWHLDAATTQFVAGQRTLPTNALQVTGVAVQVASGTAPTNGVTYPVALVGGGGTSRIFAAANGTGVGNFVLTPKVNLTVPAATYAGQYAATITLTLSAGP